MQAGWKRGVDSHRRLVEFFVGGKLDDATAEPRKHIENHKERLT